MLHLKTRGGAGRCFWKGSIQTPNRRLLEEMWDIAARGSDYLSIAIGSMAASVSVFLDLSVMGKEFTTTQWELSTSTAEIILPVNCTDRLWCTVSSCIGLKHLFCTKFIEEHKCDFWKFIDCGDTSYCLKDTKW